MDQIKFEIKKLLAKHKIKIDPADITTPPTQEMGDLALPCFELAKKMKKNPKEIAEKLAQEIKPQGMIINIKAIGPYLNFLFDYEQVSKMTIEEILKKKNKYGQNKNGKGQKVMIEYSQPNTHKQFHVGHLRNLSIGSSLINAFEANGYKVIAANYFGDSGAHVAKVLWYLINYTNKTDIPKDNKGEFLGKCYVAANRLLKEKPELQEQVSEIYQKFEAKEKKVYELYKKTRKWSIDEYKQIYKEQGARFDVDYAESMFEQGGKKIVMDLMPKHDFIKKSQGALIADLKKYDLDVLVLIRKDGTTVYGVKDIALNMEKFRKYKLDKSIIVVDNRQSMYFKQIFKILELIGFKKDQIHVAYEFVGSKGSGVFATRLGNTITYDQVRQTALHKVIKETKKRHADWSDKKVKDTALKIVIAGLKFSMLKSSVNKPIMFDINEALDVNGFTGPYIQYSLARINSIFNKSRKTCSGVKVKIDYKELNTTAEKQLIKDILKYQQVIEQIIQTNDLSVMVQYVFDLAQDFNTYYHEVPIIKAKPEIRAVRFELLKAVKQVLENSMGILGLPVLDEM